MLLPRGLAAASCITLLLKVSSIIIAPVCVCVGEPAWRYWQQRPNLCRRCLAFLKWLCFFAFCLMWSCVERSALRTLHAVMQWAFPFAKPVDINLFKDYPNIIANPVDFATIKANLEGGVYKEPQQFYDGMKLVFNNARKYNPPGSDVNLMASGVEVSLCMIRLIALCTCVLMSFPL